MDIWLMDIDGTHLANITHNALPGATNWDPAPSPDNSKVLYMGPKTGGGNYDIWVSDADGTHPRNLTNGLGGNFASWSDDGTKIIYGTDPPGETNNEEIYWMNATDGSNKTRVTNSPGRDTYPAFTPDAQHIAFTTERDGNREIYECDLFGGHLKNLTNNPGVDQVPYYSPETGDRISFISSRDGNEEIYVMNADGSNQIRLTQLAGPDHWPPTWSPDNGRIAFTADGTNNNSEIYMMNADGTGLTNLTNSAAAEAFPAWRPEPHASTNNGTHPIGSMARSTP
jgi:Tol biopolymer transport system component